MHLILLHGIWMRAGITVRLGARLAAAGYRVTRFDYASIRAPFAQHRAQLLAQIERLPHPLHLVGHSLGGVLALDCLQQSPLPAEVVSRVVCLGSPLRGSALAVRLRRMRLDSLSMGHARELLVRGLPDWTGAQQVGVIAGEIPVGLSLILGRLPGRHDGTVAESETRLPGIADHARVRTSHTGLLFSAPTAELVVRFLREGRFG
ncbi:MAG: alpha/beta fold hydrolase [Xanthomonadales bacterium PRO6]|nr:hypothetical protein [Xanthomonadales bacterium]MCE7932222.1 alpha/beta fold hydrolase [Xanthomonadales bacterium PRO6]